MTSRIRDAMTATIWEAVWEYTFRGGRITSPQADAARAARDLEKLYESANGVMSLDTLYQRAREGRTRLDEAGFGEWLVWAALGDGHAAHHKHPGVKVPTFALDVVPSKSGPVAFSWEGSDAVRRQRRQGVRRNPSETHPKFSLADVREKLAARDQERKCHPTCQGWEIFAIDRDDGLEIEVCDECASEFKDGIRDDDVAQLPEAQLALAKRFELEDAEEREEVEANVREIHGGKVVPRGNPGGRYYAFFYEPGGSRTLPKQVWGPFDDKAKAQSAIRDDQAKYGSSGKHVVKQLTDAEFTKLWHGPRGNPGLVVPAVGSRVTWSSPRNAGTSQPISGKVIKVDTRNDAGDPLVTFIDETDGEEVRAPTSELQRRGRPPGVPNPGRRNPDDDDDDDIGTD